MWTTTRHKYSHATKDLILTKKLLIEELDSILEEISSGPSILRDMDIDALRFAKMYNKIPKYSGIIYRYIFLKSRKADIELALFRIDKKMKVPVESGEMTTKDPVETKTMDSENFINRGGDTPIDSTVGFSRYPNVGQHSMVSLGDFMARPVEVASISLPLGTDILQKYDLYDLFSLNPTVRAKLRNFAYFHGDLEVSVNISGMNFHYGRILLSWQPYADYNTNLINLEALRTLNPASHKQLNTYLSQAPGSTTMDVKANKPVSMKIPFISPKPVYKLMNTSGTIAASSSYPDFQEAGTLYVTSLNQLASTSTSPSTVEMTIYVSSPNAQLGTLTAQVTEVTTESGNMEKDERETGPIEKVSTAIADVSKLLTSYPPIAPFARASYMVSSGIGSLAAHFGWSKPLMENESQFVKNVGFRNGAHTIGYDTNYKISYDPKQEISVDPRVCGTDQDDLVISNLASKDSYFESFEWEPTDSISGATLFLCGVTPCLQTVVDNGLTPVYAPTACAFAAAPFTYWRGDMVFTFQVVASSFHRGKIAVIYEPNADAFTTLTDYKDINKRYMQVFDIQETQEFSVKVNWASQTPWNLTSSNTSKVYEPASSSVIVNSTGWNGYLVVIPFTTLQSPDNSSIEINVFARCDDLHVNYTRDSGPTTRVYTESGDLFCVEEPIDLNQSSASVDHLSEDYFGEEPLSYRSLLKRYSLNRYVSIPSVGATHSLMSQDLTRRHVNPVVYGSSGNPTNLFSYLMYAYLGFRGSFRKRIYIPGSNFTSSDSQLIVSNLPIQSSDSSTNTTANVSTAGTTFASRVNGTIRVVPDSNGGVEVDLPFYSRDLFHLSFNDNPTIANIIDNSFVRNYRIIYDCVNTVPTQMHEDIAAGEDFNFLRFQGAPFHA